MSILHSLIHQVPFTLSPPLKSIKHPAKFFQIVFCLFSSKYNLHQIMKSRRLSLPLSIGIAVVAILASKTLFGTHSRVFMHNPFDILLRIEAISYSAINSVGSHNHHHHHHHHHHKPSDTKRKISVCDDFPKNIPPPDTDTASYLCVDKNGCCNFTTVQSAVDAIGNFSQKRNVIWINSGLY